MLENRIAVVTGGARGLGRAIAEALAAEGATVIITARSRSADAEATVAAIASAGGAVEAVAADATDSAAAEAAVAEVVDRHGRIDILVNNVGHFLVKPIDEVTPEEWRDMIESTVTASFIMCRAALPHMTNSGFGRIINIADSGADRLAAVSNITPYMIGKTGVLTLTRSLARHYADQDITVNAISPGVMEHSTTKPPAGEAAIPKQRFTNASDIASALRFLLSPNAGHITGINIPVAGGWDL